MFSPLLPPSAERIRVCASNHLGKSEWSREELEAAGRRLPTVGCYVVGLVVVVFAFLGDKYLTSNIFDFLNKTLKKLYTSVYLLVDFSVF